MKIHGFDTVPASMELVASWLRTFLIECRQYFALFTLIKKIVRESRPPLGVISCHSVGDAPTNSIFLDFSNKHPYFHLVKSFFIFFCNFHQKITVKIFFRPKKERFFHENGQKHIFLTNISIFCFKYVISIL